MGNPSEMSSWFQPSLGILFRPERQTRERDISIEYAFMTNESKVGNKEK